MNSRTAISLSPTPAKIPQISISSFTFLSTSRSDSGCPPYYTNMMYTIHQLSILSIIDSSQLSILSNEYLTLASQFGVSLVPSFNCNFRSVIRLLSLLYHLLIKFVTRFFLIWIPLLLSTHTAIIKGQVQISSSSVIFIPNSPISTLFCSICYILWYQINFLKLGFNQAILMINTFQWFLTSY